MSCCFGHRSQMVSHADVEFPLEAEVEYAGARMVRVVGVATGREYVFSGTARVRPMDPKDAAVLLRRRAFRLKRFVRASPHGTLGPTE